MKLLDEIIDVAASETGSVATLLRKCLVLAHTLGNDRLKVWAENELNGYDSDDAGIPEYRRTPAPAKGFFVGGFGSQINSQPIPPAILQERHRHFAESAILYQPIASYEGVDGASRFVLEWPANLTVLYQGAFFEGRYALNRAWQEVPGSVLVGLIDTIRTRVLRFALELKDDLGSVSDNLTELPKEKVDQHVVTYIFGGTNVIGSRDFTQIDSIEIREGDWTALAQALDGLGVQNPAISELKSALDHDSRDETAPTRGLGRRQQAG
jgi:AbiTii